MTIDSTTFSNGSALVQVFHETYGQPIREVPELDVPERNMRMGLIQEEYTELADAQNANDFVEVVDAWADIVYVVYGAGKTHGVDLDGVILNAVFPGHGEHGSYVIRDTPQLEVPERYDVMEIIQAEYNQLADDYNRNDFAKVQEGWANLIYAVYGAALTHGVDLNAVLLEVQRSNLSKLGTDENGNKIVLRREDGKILKGPDFSQPDILASLKAQGFKG
jgi:predicted HAD superfamily Cof-like phosphohydrolase